MKEGNISERRSIRVGTGSKGKDKKKKDDIVGESQRKRKERKKGKVSFFWEGGGGRGNLKKAKGEQRTGEKIDITKVWIG